MSKGERLPPNGFWKLLGDIRLCINIIMIVIIIGTDGLSWTAAHHGSSRSASGARRVGENKSLMPAPAPHRVPGGVVSLVPSCPPPGTAGTFLTAPQHPAGWDHGDLEGCPQAMMAHACCEDGFIHPAPTLGSMDLMLIPP